MAATRSGVSHNLTLRRWSPQELVGTTPRPLCSYSKGIWTNTTQVGVPHDACCWFRWAPEDPETRGAIHRCRDWQHGMPESDARDPRLSERASRLGFQPSVLPAAGNSKQAAHRVDTMRLAIRLYELVEPANVSSAALTRHWWASRPSIYPNVSPRKLGGSSRLLKFDLALPIPSSVIF